MSTYHFSDIRRDVLEDSNHELLLFVSELRHDDLLIEMCLRLKWWVSSARSLI